ELVRPLEHRAHLLDRVRLVARANVHRVERLGEVLLPAGLEDLPHLAVVADVVLALLEDLLLEALAEALLLVAQVPAPRKEEEDVVDARFARELLLGELGRDLLGERVEDGRELALGVAREPDDEGDDEPQHDEPADDLEELVHVSASDQPLALGRSFTM